MKYSNSDSKKAILEELKDNAAKAQSRVDEFRLIMNLIEQNANVSSQIIAEAEKFSLRASNYKQFSGWFLQSVNGSKNDAEMAAAELNSCELAKQMSALVNGVIADVNNYHSQVKQIDVQMHKDINKARSLLHAAEAELNKHQLILNTALAASMED